MAIDKKGILKRAAAWYKRGAKSQAARKKRERASDYKKHRKMHPPDRLRAMRENRSYWRRKYAAAAAAAAEGESPADSISPLEKGGTPVKGKTKKFVPKRSDPMDHFKPKPEPGDRTLPREPSKKQPQPTDEEGPYITRASGVRRRRNA